MITLQDLQQARTDLKLTAKIIREILYDGSKPKLKMYLYKMGIQNDDVEELELQCILVIVEYVRGKHKGKYHHDAIPFETFMWNTLIQTVLNELKSGNIRKDRYSSIDKIYDNSPSSEPKMWMGVDSVDEFSIDVENIFMLLTQRQGFICRCIYYNDWKHFEIQDYLGISKTEYEDEILKIKEVFKKYI